MSLMTAIRLTGGLAFGLAAVAAPPSSSADQVPPAAQIPPQKPIVISDGNLGLSLQTMSSGLARSLGLGASIKGAVVSEVLDGKPAAAAGLEPGDVIVEIDGKAVSSADEVAERLRDRKEHELRVTNVRGSREVDLPAP